MILRSFAINSSIKSYQEKLEPEHRPANLPQLRLLLTHDDYDEYFNRRRWINTAWILTEAGESHITHNLATALDLLRRVQRQLGLAQDATTKDSF